jgi:hypothetical protein
MLCLIESTKPMKNKRERADFVVII